jgi:cytochrome P450
MIWLNTSAMHRDPLVFGSPHAFLPHRFLPEGRRPASLREVPSRYVRGFEKGPRSCIAQEFALVELRAMMVLTARRFDFAPAYDALDRNLGRKTPAFDVDRAYLELTSTIQPKDGLPVFVRERAVDGGAP